MKKLRWLLKIDFLLLCFIMLCSGTFAANLSESIEKETLVPTFDLDDKFPEIVEDYFGLLLKWSQEIEVSSGVKIRATYLDPVVYVARKQFKDKIDIASREQQEKIVEEIKSFYSVYLPFEISLSHQQNQELIEPSKWHFALENSEGKTYQPLEISKINMEFKQAYAGPYWESSFVLLFPSSGEEGESVLNPQVMCLKLNYEGPCGAGQLIWEFGNSSNASVTKGQSFENYFKIIIIGVLVFLLIFFWITRPRGELSI